MAEEGVLRYLLYMRLIPALVLLLAVAPAFAQETEEGEDGLGLIERGSRMLLEEFLNRLDPALEDFQRELGPALRDFQRELGPALESLQDQLSRLDAYHPPEILPNGDIILRRKRPEEVEPSPGSEPDQDGSIEL